MSGADEGHGVAWHGEEEEVALGTCRLGQRAQGFTERLLPSRIEKLDPECQGVYVCRARSPSGQAQERVSLTVRGK